ncbi:hypothetical protein HZS_5921 [Henneguya salminicola]|nr:hypothetical protein HZS_5921 [Henneguya salminicola]
MISVTEMEFIKNNKFNCKCNEGYKGKYCKKMICPNDCNGNGHCIKPKTCACNSIYKGKFCEEYPCSENIVNPCVFAINRIIQSNALALLIILRENTVRYYFVAKNARMESGIYKCLCMDGWYGQACSILYVDYNKTHKYFQIVTFNVLIVSLLISLLFLINYNYQRQKTKLLINYLTLMYTYTIRE